MNLKPNKNLLKISLFLIVGVFTIRDFNLEVNAGASPGGIFDGRRGEKVCVFGDDLDEDKWRITPEDEENAKVSCYYNFDNCKTTIQGNADVTLYCLPPRTNYKELWNVTGLYNPPDNSIFVKCSGAAKTKSDFYSGTIDNDDYEIKYKIDFPDSQGYNYVNSIDYNMNGLPNNCNSCGNNLSSSCNLTLSTCSIDLATKTCNYGTDSATNCVAPISANVNKKKEGSFTYFCSADSRVVQCNGDRMATSYSEILESGYKQIKSGSSCRFYSSSTGTQTCKLKNTFTTDNTCQFGPTTTQNSTSNPLYKSCPDDSNEGTTTVNGRYIYCSPSNVKVSCTSPATYKELFNPIQLTDINYSTYFDYSGKSLTDSAKTNKGCELVTSAIRPNPGCSVTSSSNVGDECSIPKDCFNDSGQPPRVDGKGVYSGIVGGLYCINKGDGKPDKGNVHFCQGILQGSNYIVKAYTEISEIKTLNGVENVYFKTGAAISCTDQPAFNVNVQVPDVDPLSPIGLIRSVSNFLFYFAIFYFIVLMLSNAFAYVRSGEDPTALKKIKESLFNTIAGFLFVLLSGGVIVYLINILTS